jgi:hypothetical protein
MTVPYYNVRDLYAGNGKSTKFPYTFVITEEIHLKVSRLDEDDVPTVLVQDTDYTVNGMDETIERYVTYPKTGDPLPTGYKLLLELDLPLTQLISFIDNIFDPLKHEERFDYLTQMKAQQQRQIDGVAKVPIIHDIFEVLNENDMGGIDPSPDSPPSQSSVNIWTNNRVNDDDLIAAMGDTYAPSQRADKVYADSRIDVDPTMASPSTSLAPSQKAALTYLIPYLAPPQKDSTYIVFNFEASKIDGSIWYAHFEIDMSEPEYAQFYNRFDVTPTQGWCIPTDLYQSLHPLVCGYIYGNSERNLFAFGCQRLDGGLLSGGLGNMTIYLKA